MIFLSILLLGLGFALLWKGGDYLTNAAAHISKAFHLPEFIIGLTLVAFGTSLPELFVNVTALYQDKADIIYGNIIGSNISNMLLICGIAALIYPITLTKKMMRMLANGPD